MNGMGIALPEEMPAVRTGAGLEWPRGRADIASVESDPFFATPAPILLSYCCWKTATRTGAVKRTADCEKARAPAPIAIDEAKFAYLAAAAEAVAWALPPAGSPSSL